MGWLIVGLLIGFTLGRRRAPNIELAVNTLRTRSSAALILADKAKAVVHEAAKQAAAGQLSLLTLAELTNTIGDLGNMAGDMIDDQVALLKEVANGRT